MTTSFKEIISNSIPTLVDFYADWCGPCKAMAPVLEELKAIVGVKARIIKVNTERNQQLAASLQIRSIPTLMLYKNGELLWRHSGTASVSDLARIIEQYQ
jgi:thioredoxin 1